MSIYFYMRWRRIRLKSDLSPAGRRHGSGGPERAEAVDKTRTMQEYDCCGCCCRAALFCKLQISNHYIPPSNPPNRLNKSTTAAHYLHAAANPAHQSKRTRTSTRPPKRSHKTRTSLLRAFTRHHTSPTNKQSMEKSASPPPICRFIATAVNANRTVKTSSTTAIVRRGGTSFWML